MLGVPVVGPLFCSEIVGMDTKKDKIPDLKEVRKWVEQDVVASCYFLMMIRRSPDLMDALARLVHEEHKKEQGRLIDKVDGKSE